jgi:tripartite-type tricarboxylate transporter receptor subunit TctC
MQRRQMLALALGAAAGPAWAQARWPARPITIVVPYSPGGGPDILARLLADEFGKTIGATVVENRAGMGGSTGAAYVAKAAPDGHTLLLTTTATQSINPALYADVPYDPNKDFSAIARVAITPTVLVVANDVPAKSVQELLEYARKNPGKLSYASAGPGTMQHITAELMRAEAGVDLLHVPYKGSSQIMPDLLSGRVSMMFNSPAAVMQFVDQGKLRALAVTSSARLPKRPGVPTMAESGMPGFEASAWYGLFGPANMPPEVVQRLSAEVARVLKMPEVTARLESLGLEPAASGPDVLAQVARADLQKWSTLIKARKISAQ